jgi:hypothetical protein
VLRAALCSPSIVVMQATERWEGKDVAVVGAHRADRGLLMEPLVRARAAAVANVLGDDALEVRCVEHENVVDALATQRAEEALRGRSHCGAGRSGCRGACERIEGGPELVVAVANQEPWRHTGGRRVAKLLRHPSLRREARRRCEHSPAGIELDEHEREKRSEEHVVGLQKVASLDLRGAGGRRLFGQCWSEHVLADGAVTPFPSASSAVLSRALLPSGIWCVGTPWGAGSTAARYRIQPGRARSRSGTWTHPFTPHRN